MARSKLKLRVSTPKSNYVSKKLFPDDSKIIKRRRARPGKVALREIKYYQKTTNLLIRKMPFLRLVKEIMEQLYPYREPFRWQVDAILALQEVAEAYLINLFEFSNMVAMNAKRSTVMVRDLQMVRRIRGYDDIANR